MLTYTRLKYGNYVVQDNGQYLGWLVQELDGFFTYHPAISTGGTLFSWILRELAEKLEELNTPMQEFLDAQEDAFFEKQDEADEEPFLTYPEIIEELKHGRA